MEKSVCFTGYRPEKFSFQLIHSNEEYLSLCSSIKKAIVKLIKSGYEIFYTGGCNGFDMIVGEILLDLKKQYNIKSIIVMPYIAFGRNFDEKWVKIREILLKESDETIYIYENYRRRCYYDRNEYMVDKSSVVVTYHNGQKGGTLNTLNYAKKQNRKIINLYEENQQLSLEY